MNYRITEDTSEMKTEDIMALLDQTFWAKGRSKEKTEAAVKGSRCFGVIVEVEDKLAGFARLFTDNATSYYVCDVVVDEAHRGNGMGKALIRYITEHPEFKNLKGNLITRDAHGLYEQFGFERVEGKFMMRN